MNERGKRKRFSLGTDLQKYGRSLFTGRECETHEFVTTIQARKAWESIDEDIKRVFNVYGQGGAGKSTLLREFEAICREQKVQYVMVDAKRSTGNAIIDIIDLLWVIRTRFSLSRFQAITHTNPFNEFDEAYRRYKGLEDKVKQRAEKDLTPKDASAIGKVIGGLAAEGVKQLPGGSMVAALVDQDTLREGAREFITGTARTVREWLVGTLGNLGDAEFFQRPEPLLIDTFAEGLEKLLGDDVFVLMIDTYEELESIDTAVREQFLSNIDANLVIVLSGRYGLHDRFDHSWRAATHLFEMRPFTYDEVASYLEKSGVHQEGLAEAIHHFTQGWPLAVGLAMDMVGEIADPATASALFSTNDAEAVRGSTEPRLKIVDQVTERFLNKVPENERTLVWSLVVPTAFTPEILAALNELSELPQDIFRKLLAYSFVSPSGDAFIVHDLVRDYVLRHLKARQPKLYNALHQRAATYYRGVATDILVQQGDGAESSPEWQSATLEWLYHAFQANERAGLPLLLGHLAEALGDRDYDFALQIAYVPSRGSANADLDLRNLAESCLALKAGNDELAIKLLEQDLRQPDIPTAQHYVSAMTLGLLLMNWPFHRYREALDHFQDARRVLGDNPVPQWLVQNLLRQGNCYGHLQRWDRGHASVQEALKLAEQSKLALMVTRCRVQLARNARSQGDLKEALQLLRMVLAEPGLSDLRRLEVFDELGETLQEQGKLQEALVFYRRAYELAVIIGQRERQARLWQRMGGAYKAIDDYNAALHCFEEALRTAEEIGNSGLAANVLLDIGETHVDKAHFAEGITWLERSRLAYEQLEQESAVTALWKRMGDAFRSWGKFDEAMVHYDETRRKYTVLGQARELAALEGALGGMWQSRGDYKAAIAAYTRSLNLYSDLEQPLHGAYYWEYLGDAYRLWGKFSEAERHYQEAKTRYEQLGRPTDVADVLLGLGLMAREQGNYAQAVDWLEQSRAIYAQLDRPLNVAHRWNSLAIAYREWGKFSEAEQHYQEARQRYEELEQPANVASVLLELGRTAQAQGNYAQAVNWLEQSRTRYAQLGRQLDVARLWDWLGDAYREWGKFSEAEQHYQEAKTRYEQLGRPTDVADVLLGLGLMAREQGNYAQAVDWLEQSRAIYAQLNRPLNVAHRWNSLAIAYREWGKFSEAEQHYQEARQRYEELEQPANVASVLLELGRTAQAQGNYAQAVNWLEQSRTRYAQLGRQLDVARLWDWLGDAYREWGKFGEAERHYQEAKARYEQLDRPADIADVLWGLGRVAREQGNYAQAVAWLEQSRTLYAQLNRSLNEASLWNWLSYTYREWGKFGEAERHYQEAKARYEQLDRPANVANVLMGLGYVAREQGNYAQAVAWLEQGRALYAQLNRPLNEANHWEYLGNTYREWGKFGEAERHYQEAKARYEQLDRPADVADVLWGLGRVAREQGNYAQAVAWLEQSRALYVQLDHPLNEARRLVSLAIAYREWGKFGEAERHYQKAKARYEQLDRPADVASVLLGLGRAACEQGNYAQAVAWLEQSRALYAQLDRPLDEGNLCDWLGSTYRLWGRFEEAELHYQDARQRYEQLERPSDVAEVLLGLALLDRERGDNVNGMAKLLQGREKHQLLGIHAEIANFTSRISAMAVDIGDGSQALAYSTEAIQLAEKLALKQPWIRALTALGYYYCKRGDFSQAEQSFNGAGRLLKEIDDLAKEAHVRVGLGQVAWLQGHKEASDQAFKSALALFEQRVFPRDLAQTYKDIGKFYADNGERALARQYLEQARDRFAQLDVAYQVEQITLLLASLPDADAAAASC